MEVPNSVKDELLNYNFDNAKVNIKLSIWYLINILMKKKIFFRHISLHQYLECLREKKNTVNMDILDWLKL